MSTWKHGQKWRYQFNWQGQRIRPEQGYETQTEARLAEAERKVELSRLPEIRTDFVQLCEKRLTDISLRRDHWYYSDNQSMFSRLIELGWAFKKSITSADIKEFLDHVAASVSPQRANKYRAYLSALFNSDKRYRAYNLVNSKEVPKYPEARIPKYIPPEVDILAVMELCTQEQRDYLWTLALTAARCGEINKLKVADVHLHLGYLTLATKKAKDGTINHRRIGIRDSLRDIVVRRLTTAQAAGSEYLFFQILKKGAKPIPFGYRSKFLKSKCDDAKVRPFTYHCLRHFAAILMDQAGVPLVNIQKTLGHQRATTTDVYLGSIREVQGGVADLIEERLGGHYKKSLQKQNQKKKP